MGAGCHSIPSPGVICRVSDPSIAPRQRCCRSVSPWLDEKISASPPGTWATYWTSKSPTAIGRGLAPAVGRHRVEVAEAGTLPRERDPSAPAPEELAAGRHRVEDASRAGRGREPPSAPPRPRPPRSPRGYSTASTPGARKNGSWSFRLGDSHEGDLAPVRRPHRASVPVHRRVQVAQGAVAQLQHADECVVSPPAGPREPDLVGRQDHLAGASPARHQLFRLRVRVADGPAAGSRRHGCSRAGCRPPVRSGEWPWTSRAAPLPPRSAVHTSRRAPRGSLVGLGISPARLGAPPRTNATTRPFAETASPPISWPSSPLNSVTARPLHSGPLATHTFRSPPLVAHPGDHWRRSRGHQPRRERPADQSVQVQLLALHRGGQRGSGWDGNGQPKAGHKNRGPADHGVSLVRLLPATEDRPPRQWPCASGSSPPPPASYPLRSDGSKG